MILVIENVKKEFLPVFESLAKSIKADCQIKYSKSESSVQKAIKEIKKGKCESFNNFEEYKKAMRNV